MSFFVIGRGRADGLLRLLGQEAHETREDAVRAVQGLAMSGEVSVDDVDVYIADLGAAAPVMIVGMPAAIPAEEASAGVWEAPASAVVHDLPEQDPGDVLLADALQRAATRLEEEGIIAPESVGFEEEVDVPVESAEESIEEPGVVTAVVEPSGVLDQDDALEAEPAIADDLSAVIASLGSLDEAVVTESETVVIEEAVTDESGEWPWLNVGEVAIVDTASTEAEVPLEVAEAFAEPEPESDESVEQVVEPEAQPEPVIAPEPAPIVYDDSDTLIMTPAMDDEFTPQPIIMGDYPITPEPLAEEALDADLDSSVDAAVAAALTDVASLPEVAEPAAAYEPAGDLTLEEYTCADCVYSNTCPKVNQTTPAECGAFQWKTV